MLSIIGVFRVYAAEDAFTITKVEIPEKSATVNVKELSKDLYDQGAKKVTTCVLASKIGTRKVEFEADYKALEVPNEFVFGYGLDYDGYYRNLPYIAALKDELYK